MARQSPRDEALIDRHLETPAYRKWAKQVARADSPKPRHENRGITAKTLGSPTGAEGCYRRCVEHND